MKAAVDDLEADVVSKHLAQRVGGGAGVDDRSIEIDVRVLEGEEQSVGDPGEPAVCDHHAKIRELVHDALERERLRPGRAALRSPAEPAVHEDRDLQAHARLVDGEGRLLVVDVEQLQRWVELEAFQPEAAHRLLEGGRGLLEVWVDRSEADQAGILGDETCDRLVAEYLAAVCRGAVDR